MAFQHPQLAVALEYKWKDHPNFGDGISTRNGTLIKFPAAIGPFPSDADLQQWVTDWENRPPSREEEFDTAIDADTQIQAFKAMTNAQFDTWWDANVTNAAQAITVLKRLARLIIRKVL